jgi:putative phage-type endonuclease
MHEQGSDGWKKERAGKVTASRIADLMATTKSGYAASRTNYMAQLVIERMTGAPVSDGYTNAAMIWGIEQEPSARELYEFLYDAPVEQVGFIAHPVILMAGASPDGLVGTDGLVEIKCPLTATHIETLLTQTIPDKYIKQMQFQMACTGREWTDYFSFDPRMPEKLQVFKQRVPRDPAFITTMEREINKFLAELDEKIEALERIAA